MKDNYKTKASSHAFNNKKKSGALCCEYIKTDNRLIVGRQGWAPQGFGGSGEKGYLFSGSWGALLIILGELGSKHILLGI